MPYPFPIFAEGWGGWEGGEGEEEHALGAPRLGSAPIFWGLLQGAACSMGMLGSAGMSALADAALSAGPTACAAATIVVGAPSSMAIASISAASSTMSERAESTAEWSLAS